MVSKDEYQANIRRTLGAVDNRRFSEPTEHFVNLRTLTNKELIPMVEWLDLNIGVEGDDWTFGLYAGKNYHMCDKFSFKNEEDRVKFILKWL